jgi:YD repeat-containing protein
LSFAVRDSAATTRFDHDGLGRLARTTLPAGAGQMEWTHDGGHNPVELAETEVSSTGAGGPPDEVFLTTGFFDALNRPVMVVDNLGQTRRTEYDSLNRVTTTSDARGPAGGSILRRSPGRETMTVAVNGHGNVTNRSYDGLGRLLTTASILTASGEGDGTVSPSPDTSNSYNPDGLITLTRAWDGNSLPAGGQDDRGNSTTHTYDNLNRLVLFTADDGTSAQFGYDTQGNLTSHTDPNGTIVSHTYDDAHRLVETDVSPATGVEGTTEQTFEHDGLSRLTLAIDNNDPTSTEDDVTVGFLHDSLSRVIEEGQQVGGGTGVEVLTTDFGWLAADLLTDLIYPSGRHIQYGYDGADRLVSVGDVDTSRTEGASYDYFGLGRVHTRDSNNGVRSTRLDDAGTTDIGFDGVGRTTLLRHIDPSTGTLLAGFEYRYDAVSNPTSHRRLHHQDATGGDFKGETYTYDSADRLISFQEGFLDSDHGPGSPPDGIQSWILDGAGNWNETTRNDVDYLATPNNLNEYDEPQSGGTRVDDGVPDDFLDDASTSDPDGLNLAHDKNGNQVNIGLFEIRYDFLSRPVRAYRNSDSMQVAQYHYDALGRRVGRQVLNSGSLNETLRSHYALGSLVEERDGTDAVVRQVVFGRGPGERLWQIRGSGGPTLQSEYFLEDALGSSAALTGGTGPTVVERITYDAYGTEPGRRSSSGSPTTLTASRPSRAPATSPSRMFSAISSPGAFTETRTCSGGCTTIPKPVFGRTM